MSLFPSRVTKFSGANANRETFIFPVQLTTSRIGNLTRLIHTLAICMCDHTYILHACAPTARRSHLTTIVCVLFRFCFFFFMFPSFVSLGIDVAFSVSRDQILRREREQRNLHFPCSADHEQDWQPYPVDPYSCYMYV